MRYYSINVFSFQDKVYDGDKLISGTLEALVEIFLPTAKYIPDVSFSLIDVFDVCYISFFNETCDEGASTTCAGTALLYAFIFTSRDLMFTLFF